MRRLLSCLVFGLAGLVPALAFDGETQSVLDRMKLGKPMPISEVAVLMRNAERWCYIESDGACSWSDIYLDVSETGAVFEIGNAWDADINVAFTDRGTFEDGRYICESGKDWVPSLRATNRADGSTIYGRPLWALKAEVDQVRNRTIECFDYELRASDPEAQTVTLLQREYSDGVTDPSNDVTVTVHFDAATAAALTWYY